MPKEIFYAMEPNALQRYADFKDKVSFESLNLSAEKIKDISIQLQESREESREIYTTDEEGIAHIVVSGPLEPKPDPCAIMFNAEMTTYRDIIIATKKADEDQNINKIVYHFDSPGGNVVGLFATADVIREAKTETLAINHGLMASAAYALGSQCNSIECENISCETGSIGVATEVIDRSGLDSGNGIKRHILTSKNAENKRPDVTTDEGRAKIISRLTDLESVFIEYVASGRNTTTENVLENFGRGGILIARDARDTGMVDSIQSEINSDSSLSQKKPEARDTTGGGNQIQGEDTMGDITMSEEDFEARINAAAEKGAEKAVSTLDEKLDARDKKIAEESKRKEGFTALLNKYPEQSAMIKTEMGKDGAVASAEFAISVSEAEASRIKAKEEQDKNSDDNPEGTASTTDHDNDVDESGNLLAASLGLDVKGA